MLVRWLCSFPASALLDLVGLSTLVLPRPQEMHPSAKVREPTGCVFVQGRLKQVCPDGLAVTGFWAGNAPYFEKRPESELLDLHVHRGPRPESSGIRWGRPAERHKKQRQRQATQPGENSQKDTLQRRLAKVLQITKLGDDQERRPTPFPSGAKRKSDCPARRQ